MEESKPVPCSEQHAQRFCCAILKRHTVVSIMPNAFRRFVLRHVESSIPEIEALIPALTTACIQYFEKHFFFRMLFKIDYLSNFLPHKKYTSFFVDRTYIFSGLSRLPSKREWTGLSLYQVISSPALSPAEQSGTTY